VHVNEGEFVTQRGLRVDPAAVTWTATRSGGPGGQHANTSDTAVELSVELRAAGFEDYLTERIVGMLGERLVVRASDTRSQWRNRQLAWERAAERIDRASRPQTPRRPTRVPKGVQRRRLQEKRHRADTKATRRRPATDE
jgi:ribosome-associated protein